MAINYSQSFRVLKYLDEFGDTSFNAKMLEDLAFDLIQLRSTLTTGEEGINELLGLVDQCQKGTHLYLKFYGD